MSYSQLCVLLEILISPVFMIIQHQVGARTVKRVYSHCNQGQLGTRNWHIFHVHATSRKIKKKRMSFTNKKRENGKLKIQHPSSLTL